MSLDAPWNQTEHRFAPYWAVHSEKEGQPTLRDWTTSESDAQVRLRAIQAADDDAETTYWVMQMTEAEVASFQAAGVIPPEG